MILPEWAACIWHAMSPRLISRSAFDISVVMFTVDKIVSSVIAMNIYQILCKEY
jgi:hypothetical protein